MKIISKNQNLIFRMNSKGQAVLEYVLLLVVILILFLGLIKSIADSTQRLAQNYFGSYLQCLLETGELPSLGADGVPETECDDLYEEFTVAKGRPLNVKPMGDINQTTTDPAGDYSSGSGGNTADASSSGGSSGASDGGSSAYGGSGSSFGGTGFSGRTAKVPLSKGEKGSGEEDDGALSGSKGFNNFAQNDRFGADGTGRSPYVPVYGTRQLEDEENKASAVVKTTVPESEEQILRGKRVPAKVQKKAEVKEQEEESIGFSGFLKFLIIAAIIIAIVIFLGGQVMQYQKSKE